MEAHHYLGSLRKTGHTLWLLETFVDPRHFQGTIYRAANWLYIGDTRSFRRVRGGYGATAQAPKRVFVRPQIPSGAGPFIPAITRSS